MLGFVTLTLPALQDWGFRGMGQRWALSLLCLQSIRWVEARFLLCVCVSFLLAVGGDMMVM